MNKIYSLLLAITTLATFDQASAQGFYLRGGVGYAFPFATQTMDPFNGPYSGSITDNVIYRIKGASFGAGANVNVGLGYMFNEYTGVQLDANIGASSKKYTYTDNDVVNNVFFPGNIPSTLEVNQRANTSFLLTPSIVFQTPCSKVGAYGRIGAVLPLKEEVAQETIYRNKPGTGAATITTVNWLYTTSFSLGLSGAVGMQYLISPQFMVWSEVNFTSMSLYVKSQNIKSLYRDGNSYQVSGSIAYGKNVTFDTTNFTTIPTYSLPYSNVGISVGVKYTLGDGRHASSGKKKF